MYAIRSYYDFIPKSMHSGRLLKIATSNNNTEVVIVASFNIIQKFHDISNFEVNLKNALKLESVNRNNFV